MRRAVWLLCLTSCTSQPTARVLPSSPEASYYGAVEPVIQRVCVGCHGPLGSAPFPLTTWADVRSHADEILTAVETRRMPPFPPDPDDCLPIADDRMLPRTDRETLLSWARGRRLEGDPRQALQATQPRPDPLGPASAVLDSGGDYLSTSSATDEYRCFVFEPGFTSAYPLVAVNAESTQTPLVHHALVSAVTPEEADTVRARDAADPRPGYDCWDGNGAPRPIRIGTSVPNSHVPQFPAGTALSVAPGSVFVVEVHYNYGAAVARGAEHLKLALWRAASDELTPVQQLTLGGNPFVIPAGAPRTVNVWRSGPLLAASDLLMVMPHMHKLGTSIRVEVERAGQGRVCVMWIPRWDFAWQDTYALATPLALRLGDRLTLTCEWNNAQGTTDVRPGLGSDDEMCLMVLTTTK